VWTDISLFQRFNFQFKLHDGCRDQGKQCHCLLAQKSHEDRQLCCCRPQFDHLELATLAVGSKEWVGLTWFQCATFHCLCGQKDSYHIP
jgi:hypothetical protein